MNTACSVDQAGTRARASAEKWLLDDEGPCCSSGGQLFGEGPQGMLLACSLAAGFTSQPAVQGGGAARPSPEQWDVETTKAAHGNGFSSFAF